MSPTTLSRALEQGRDELTVEEAEQFADEQARKYLKMPIDRFRQLASEDRLPYDDPMVVHIALLAGVELHSC
jgi:hypothetical protein